MIPMELAEDAQRAVCARTQSRPLHAECSVGRDGPWLALITGTEANLVMSRSTCLSFVGNGVRFSLRIRLTTFSGR